MAGRAVTRIISTTAGHYSEVDRKVPHAAQVR
jgi:hypothetical protein